jgi:hypothetical protein
VEARRRQWAIGAAILLVTAACSATIGPGGGATPTPFVDPTDTPYAGPATGTWTGTITFTGVINVDKTEPGHSDLDPNNTYYEEWVTTEATHLNATDTFTIAAADDDDLTYGIHSVDLQGSAANSGTTLERYVTVTDKGNSGCTWKQEDGDETTGSWSGSGSSVGELQFSEDGSYFIRIRADAGDPAVVPHRYWLKYSDISANCEVNEPEFDNTEDGAPIVEWVSSHLGEADVDGTYISIEGQLNTANPGTTVDGTKTWEMAFPEGLTITITWHLVHSGPIVLPHS